MLNIDENKNISLTVKEKQDILNQILSKDATAILSFQQKPETSKLPTLLGPDKKRLSACDHTGNLHAEAKQVIEEYLKSPNLQDEPRAKLVAVMQHQTKREDALL